MALGGRLFLFWDRNTDPQSQFVFWDAQEITKRFGLKNDEHIGLVQGKAFQDTTTSGAVQLFLQADRRGVDITKLESGVQGVLPTPGNIATVGGESNAPINHKVMAWFVEADNFSDLDRPAEHIEVFESIMWVKSAANEWQVILDFVFLEGPMRWKHEDYLKDMAKVPRQRTPGMPFYQAGDRYVIGEREYS